MNLNVRSWSRRARLILAGLSIAIILGSTAIGALASSVEERRDREAFDRIVCRTMEARLSSYCD